MFIFNGKDNNNSHDNTEDSFGFITDVSSVGTLKTDSPYSSRQGVKTTTDDTVKFKTLTKKILEGST